MILDAPSAYASQVGLKDQIGREFWENLDHCFFMTEKLLLDYH